MKKEYIKPSMSLHNISVQPVLIGTSGDSGDANSSNQAKDRDDEFIEYDLSGVFSQDWLWQ